MKLLILCSYESPESLRDRVAARMLLWGLEERGVEWELGRPWEPIDGLGGYDCLLTWSYRYGRHDFVAAARRVERRAAELGVPVVNPVAGCDTPHSGFLSTWSDHGVPCARHHRFGGYYAELPLDYPVIVRRDGVHKGQDVFLARTAEEARELIEGRRMEVLLSPPRKRRKRMFDLAIEFVDTRDARGIFRKWRSYVIGDTIIPRQLSLSKHWLVNFDNLITDESAIREDREFVRDGEPEAELVRKAARLAGGDIVALDYGRRPDGGIVFWEANRHFLMLGDKGYEKPGRFTAATGRSDAERRLQDESVGLAIADLVLARVGAEPRPRAAGGAVAPSVRGRPRLLILTAYSGAAGMKKFQAGRQLLAELARKQIPYELRQPWRPIEDLASFDVVLCWTYRHTWGDMLVHAREVERECRRLDVPLVNPPSRFTYLHSGDLAAWREAGIPCARAARFEDPAALDLPFPLILRRDGQHKGRDMFLVHDLEEARRAVERYRGATARALDLAVEFIDTRWPDGHYRKRRCYVVGGEVIPAHSLRSESWIVNYDSVTDDMTSFKEDREFVRGGEPQAELVARAVSVLDADFAAVDYGARPDGGLVFWEANRNPRTWGDRGYPKTKPRAADRRYGRALVALVEQRARE